MALTYSDQMLKSNIESVDDKDAGKRITFLAIAGGLSAMAFSITLPFLPIYLHTNRGFAMSQVGLIFPAMGLAAIIGSPISGMLIDKIGSQKIMIAGPIMRGVVFFIVALGTSLNAPFSFFVIGLFGTAFSGIFFQNASNTYVTGLIDKSARTVAFSRINVGVNLGFMLGPAIGSFLASTPFSLLFSITGGLCFVMGIVPMYLCPQLPLDQRVKRSKVKKEESFYQIIKTDSFFLVFLVFVFFIFVSESQFISTLSIYSTKIVGINKNSLGFLYTLNGAIVILFLIPVNRILSKINIYLRIGTGAFIYVISLTIWGVSQSWIHLAIGVCVLTAAEIFSKTAMVTAAGGLSRQVILGRYMGLFGLVQGIGLALGPYIGALTFEYYADQPLIMWRILSAPVFVGGCGFLGMYIFNITKRNHI